MAAQSGATTAMNGFLVVLQSAAILACERLPEEYGGPLVTCVVQWRGTLATDSNAFNVQACYNSRCTSRISVQAARADGGSTMEYPDAGCVPTTPGGLPSRCDSLPVAPGPGCGTGEIAKEFAVQACAQSQSDGTYFSIALIPSTSSLPDGGDQFELTIGTIGGTSLVEANGNVPRNDPTPESNADCRGAVFDLDGVPVPE